MSDQSILKSNLEQILSAIDLINSQQQFIKSASDFVSSQHGMFTLGGICMQLIFIGEKIKTIHHHQGEDYLAGYTQVPWRAIMGLRNIIAHEYHHIDEDEIYNIMADDLPTLRATVELMLNDIKP